MKKINFMPSTHFKFMSHIKRNSTNDCDFLKLKILLEVAIVIEPGVKKPAMPLSSKK
jgi:hypothetical protein